MGRMLLVTEACWQQHRTRPGSSLLVCRDMFISLSSLLDSQLDDRRAAGRTHAHHVGRQAQYLHLHQGTGRDRATERGTGTSPLHHQTFHRHQQHEGAVPGLGGLSARGHWALSGGEGVGSWWGVGSSIVALVGVAGWMWLGTWLDGWMTSLFYVMSDLQYL